ncbi:MAG: UDP-N-acetylmuramoyl-L-alanyl-D-glutamate--2,6-diaminopimelate ligase [Ruminococcaceae bacterium]|nr:UDP-N-acetylmuramoyl-L-alanyl-D-glutamate--2,6-diaminopimelate ligase [Oscillospiraceae bacterium]
MKYDLFGIRDIIYDSRRAAPDTAFVCLVGASFDGHDYAKMAYDKGSRLFFAQRELDLPCDAKVIICEDTRITLAEVSRQFFGYPDKELKIIGITGTKGKTTTSNIIAQILNKCGKNAAVIGTNGIIINGELTPTVNTTPESNELYRTFDKMVKAGCEYCVMEVSSQAVKLNRIHGIEFEIGVFTNLSPDHISDIEHKTYEEYRECKSGLFARSRNSVINIDDDDSPYMLEAAMDKVYTISLHNGDFTADNIEKYSTDSVLGMSFDCKYDEVRTKLKVSTPGIYSVYNGMTAFAVCRILGISAVDVAKNLPFCRVNGRFEIIDALPYATFIIDYAHNGVSLESVLKTLKEYDPKRLIVLFGSVGERTQLRRRELAEAAAEYADLAVVTSDNPGCEDPDAIIDEIIEHISDLPYVRFADRTEAIGYVVENAEQGDVILLAGKGHETYQLIGKEKVPFCERDILLDSSRVLTTKK